MDKKEGGYPLGCLLLILTPFVLFFWFTTPDDPEREEIIARATINSSFEDYRAEQDEAYRSRSEQNIGDLESERRDEIERAVIATLEVERLDELLSCPHVQKERGVVTEVIDGDTIIVNVGSRLLTVRYIGINTAEFDENFYEEATQANRDLVEGNTVDLWGEVSNEDRYGRLLRHVYVFTDRGVGWV